MAENNQDSIELDAELFDLIANETLTDTELNKAEALLQAGVNVNHVDESRDYSLLMMAAQNRHVKIVRLLLKNGADVNYTGKDNWTALHCAIDGGMSSHDRDATGFDDIRDNPNTIIIVEELLKHRAKVNKTINGSCFYGKYGDSVDNATPLMMACLTNQKDVIKLLLAYGADPEIEAWDNFDDVEMQGNTALMVAARYGDMESVYMLLKYGADPVHYMTQRSMGVTKMTCALTISPSLAKFLLSRYQHDFRYDSHREIRTIIANFLINNCYHKNEISASRDNELRSVEYITDNDADSAETINHGSGVHWNSFYKKPNDLADLFRLKSGESLVDFEAIMNKQFPNGIRGLRKNIKSYFGFFLQDANKIYQSAFAGEYPLIKSYIYDNQIRYLPVEIISEIKEYISEGEIVKKSYIGGSIVNDARRRFSKQYTDAMKKRDFEELKKTLAKKNEVEDMNLLILSKCATEILSNKRHLEADETDKPDSKKLKLS